MWADTRPGAAAVSPQCPSFHHTSLYEWPRQWPVCSRDRQVRVLSYPRGGTHVIDSVTAFDDPLERIRTGQFAHVPILLGNMEDDGTSMTYNTSESLSSFLADQFGPLAGSVPADKVRALYPGLSDPQVIASIVRDIVFRWCVHFLVFCNMKGNNKWKSCTHKAPQNCGAMHLSHLGSGACTGILTVRAQQSHLSLRGSVLTCLRI
jgi:carboxylesterase type B